MELCTTRQLESLAEEFCYDVETLRSVSATLDGRTCRHSAHVKRSVERQLKALTSGPPPRRRLPRVNVRWLGLAAVAAVLVAAAVDQVGQWLALV
jgi:hypothetical protein